MPFEYHPGWKAFWARPSGEISLIKRFVLGLSRSGHCPECLEAGIESIYHGKFTLTRTVSSGSQLVALKLRKWHDLIMIHDKLINTIRKQPIKTVLF
ncbi:hypothetical protein, partial [Lactiplantibacillus pentosus]|uniref:hypothetical protein n=1 Tax=Lactiplantibacillus pentosus TaxID=1589 RepID=UPI003F52A76A